MQQQAYCNFIYVSWVQRPLKTQRIVMCICDSGLESTEMQELLFTSLTVIFLKTWTVYCIAMFTNSNYI